ncbi:hypothetical protein V6Z12_A10G205000 [Gossypium hirsutum]
MAEGLTTILLILDWLKLGTDAFHDHDLGPDNMEGKTVVAKLSPTSGVNSFSKSSSISITTSTEPSKSFTTADMEGLLAESVCKHHAATFIISTTSTRLTAYHCCTYQLNPRVVLPLAFFQKVSINAYLLLVEIHRCFAARTELLGL